MGNLGGVFSQENTPERHTKTHKSSFFPYKQASGRNGDPESLRMNNAFILCDLLWKVQKSHAVNREGSFNYTIWPALSYSCLLEYHSSLVYRESYSCWAYVVGVSHIIMIAVTEESLCHYYLQIVLPATVWLFNSSYATYNTHIKPFTTQQNAVTEK